METPSQSSNRCIRLLPLATVATLATLSRAGLDWASQGNEAVGDSHRKPSNRCSSANAIKLEIFILRVRGGLEDRHFPSEPRRTSFSWALSRAESYVVRHGVSGPSNLNTPRRLYRSQETGTWVASHVPPSLPSEGNLICQNGYLGASTRARKKGLSACEGDKQRCNRRRQKNGTLGRGANGRFAIHKQRSQVLANGPEPFRFI